ncbi:MAG: glycosyltransferase [Pseudomonadota bacterium]
MRIVDVCAFYTAHGGGVKTYIDRKFAAASIAGHEMVVIAPGARDEVIEFGPGQILATIASPQLALDRRYRYFANEPALHRALDHWRPDFVEASSPWSSASMVARWEGSAPRSLVMHADPLAAYAYRWFGRLADIATIDHHFDRFWQHLRRLDARFNHVISASVNLTNRLVAGGLRRATTIAMGVEPGIFSPAHRDLELRRRMLALCGLDPDATLMLGVGRYSAEKRWGMVIDAVQSAGAEIPIGLVLIGDGRARRALVAHAAGSPHIMVGAPIRERRLLAATMASADALIHGCEAETFCMVAAEARASGLPIIVPDRGGAADHVTQGASRHFAAADGSALRNSIVDFARRAIAPGEYGAAYPVRTMDQHFDQLFDLYGAHAASKCQAA